MHCIYNIVERRQYLVFSILLTVGLYSLMMSVLPSKISQQIVTLQLSFTVEQAAPILNNWGNQLISQYLSWYWVDYLFALAYSWSLIGLLDWVWPIKRSFRSLYSGLVFILPIIALGCDWLENSLHFFLLLSYPIIHPWLVMLAACFALLKWSALATVGIMMVVSLVIKFRLIGRFLIK